MDDLPLLHNLEELELAVHDVMSLALIPHLSNACFPKLKKIRLGAMHTGVRVHAGYYHTVSAITGECIRKYFWKVCDDPLNTVDKLELESYCDANAMEHLAKVFPRVTCPT